MRSRTTNESSERSIFLLWMTHFGLSLIHFTPWLSPIYAALFHHQKICWKERAVQECTVSKTAQKKTREKKKKKAGKNPIASIQTSNLEIISQSSKEKTCRGECKHDRDDSEREKQIFGSGGLTAADGFWVIAQHLCGPPSREEEYHWFAHCNYSVDSALIERDVISRKPNKSVWKSMQSQDNTRFNTSWIRKAEMTAVVLKPPWIVMKKWRWYSVSLPLLVSVSL